MITYAWINKSWTPGQRSALIRAVILCIVKVTESHQVQLDEDLP